MDGMSDLVARMLSAPLLLCLTGPRMHLRWRQRDCENGRLLSGIQNGESSCARSLSPIPSLGKRFLRLRQTFPRLWSPTHRVWGTGQNLSLFGQA